MTTFQVYCKGTARRWLPYSREFRTMAEAEACVRRAEALENYSVTGAPRLEAALQFQLQNRPAHPPGRRGLIAETEGGAHHDEP